MFKRTKNKSMKRRSKSKNKSIKRSLSSNIIILQKSKLSTHKFSALVGNKTVNFGAKGYEDLLIHKDLDRMKRYEKRQN